MSILGVAVFIVVVGFLTKNLQKGVAETPSQTNANLATGYLTIRNIRVDVEIVKTDEERAKGLSFRSDLKQYSGLLFDFKDQNKQPIFWMKDTSIPLDIIWIKNDKIVKINANVQPEKSDTLEKNYKLYKAPSIIDYVLEVNGNWCDQNGISVGDSVSFFLWGKT